MQTFTHIRSCIAAATVMAILPSTAMAQTSPPPSLQALTNTPSYQQNISNLFAKLPADVFQRCPALVSKGSRVTVLQPVSFAADGYPTAGVWKQSFPVQGCGNDTTINFFFAAQPNENIRSIVAMPGDTHADLVLQTDAIRYVMLAVHGKAKDCATLHVRNTRYDRQLTDEKPIPKAASWPWREIWTVSACGTSYDVPITFIPDATGTTISTTAATPVPN